MWRPCDAKMYLWKLTVVVSVFRCRQATVYDLNTKYTCTGEKLSIAPVWWRSRISQPSVWRQSFILDKKLTTRVEICLSSRYTGCRFYYLYIYFIRETCILANHPYFGRRLNIFKPNFMLYYCFTLLPYWTMKLLAKFNFKQD